MRVAIPARQAGVALAGLLLAFAPRLDAQQKEAPPAPGTPKDFRLPPRRVIKLPNGMEMSLIHYGAVPKVAVSLQIMTGGIDEGQSEVQLSELTAEMLLEGTATRSAGDISRQAAEMGGSLIASSDDDAVSMGGEVLSEFADRYVALVADVVRHPRFSTADVARLRTNMIRDNAIALSEPGQISRATFRRLMFGDHPYGRIFAPESLLAHYDSASVRRFYTKNYDARRARLYVSGVFEDSTVERAVRAAFAGWPGGKPATINAPRPADRRQVELVDRPDAVQSTIRLGLPVADPDSPDWIRLSVTDAILGGAFGSRITSNIREDKGYSYSPFSYLSPWPGTALWIDIADVTTSVTGASLKEIFYEVDRLRGEPPGVKELDGIKQNLAGIFTIQNSSRYGLIGQLQFVDLYRLGDGYITNYVRNVVGVTPEEVQNTARRYLDPSRMTITVVGDRKTVESQLAPYRASTP